MATTSSKIHSYRPRDPRSSLIYKVLADHLAPFKIHKLNLPWHVAQTFSALLTCGLPEHGFMRIKCQACPVEGIVPFSCKKRGPCSSCGSKRMVEATAHMVDNVLPHARYRQIVVTLPFPFRFWVAAKNDLLSWLHRTIIRTLHRKVTSLAHAKGLEDPAVGSVTYLQRFGSGLQLTPHFHILLMEKAFCVAKDGQVVSYNLPKLGEWDVKEILQDIIILVIRGLQKRGYIAAEQGGEQDPAPLDELWREHPQLLIEAMQVPPGPRQLIAPGFGYDDELPLKNGKLCYQQNGFTIHAARVVNSSDRRGLEQLIAYMARPAISADKLSYDGQSVTYQLKAPWSDGRTELKFTPLGFLGRLAALIPPPRSHTARHSGVLAPAHRLIILNPDKKKVYQPSGPPGENRLVKNYTWARLLARIFEVDVGSCSRCQSPMQIVSFVTDPAQIRRYLQHVGRLATGPPSVEDEQELKLEYDQDT